MSGLFEWFAQPGVSNLSQWIISLLALILSGIGLFIGIRNNRREGAIQSRLLAIEEERQAQQHKETKRAKLRAYLQRSGRNSYHIVIRNEGDALARDVQVRLDDKPILDHPVIPKGETEVRKIGQNSEARYIAAVSSDCAPPYDIAIQWKDESDEVGTYETTLT